MFNPASPTLPASGSVTDTLTVLVSSMPAAAPPVRSWPWGPPRVPPRVLWLLAALALSLLMTYWLCRVRLRRVAAIVALLGAALLVLAASYCGGGSTSPPPRSSAVETITVQASGAGVSGTQTLGTLSITVD